MSTNTQLNREHVWKLLYEAALLEFNPTILPQRVAEAVDAINAHWAKLKQSGDRSGDQWLTDALLALRQLLQMRGINSGDAS